MGKLARQFKARAGKAQGKVQDIYNRQQTADRMKKFGNLIGGLAQNKIKLDQVGKMRDVLKRQALTASEKLNQEDLDPMEKFMYEQQLQNVDLLNANLNINTIGSFFSDALAVNKALDPSGLIQAQMNLDATNRWRDLTLELRRQNQAGQQLYRDTQIDKMRQDIKDKELKLRAKEMVMDKHTGGMFGIGAGGSGNPSGASTFIDAPLRFLKNLMD